MQPRCPYATPYILDGETFSIEEVIERLGPLLAPERRERLWATVQQRTYTVVPVMENLYDRGNISAVLRSAEALGYQAIHIIDTAKKFKKANRVTQGAEKWLDINSWSSTAEGVKQLRDRGYKIVATHFDNAQPIHQFAFDTPTALVFGNESDGVSEELLAEADARVFVPMPGFTRSFNISVAAALCLYHAQQDRLRRDGTYGDLSPDEQRGLLAAYYRRAIHSADKVLRDARRTKQPAS
jgi:tRNA (guanosine-2'-O-)-methyltransferase